jgi:hypothetical protein
MSLSDYVKFMRATKGGVTPWEIADATGIPSKDVHLIEVKHRRMGEDDAVLAKLAGYFEVPLEALTGRREAYRKRLTGTLSEHQRTGDPLAITLESGETITGQVVWFGREALALLPPGTPEDRPIVVQRAVVADWH